VRRRRITGLICGFGIATLLYASVVLYYASQEQSIVYQPSRTFIPPQPNIQNRMKVITFSSSDGTQLTGWIILAESPKERRWIYFLHGNAGNVSTSAPWLSALHKLGINVFALDYRGYGESGGVPSELGIYRDSSAGYEYLMKSRSVEPNHLLVYGHSLGAAVAVELATRVPIAGVVLEGAFLSIPKLGKEFYPFLPASLIIRNRFDSENRIAAVSCPKLFLHARFDTLVPIHEALELFRTAKAPKRFRVLAGDHADAITRDEDNVIREVSDFEEQVIGN
jgi:pimeloyl-ACP methyl ester carboxylesterase